MKVTINGRHVKVSDKVEAYARDKAGKLAHFFDRLDHVTVTLGADGKSQVSAEMEVTLVRGVRLVGKASAGDFLSAIDLAEAKLQRQIQKFHDRLKAHRARTAGGGGRPPTQAETEKTYEQVVREMLDEKED
jgi:putative sigma-54 modulation protein